MKGFHVETNTGTMFVTETESKIKSHIYYITQGPSLPTIPFKVHPYPTFQSLSLPMLSLQIPLTFNLILICSTSLVLLIS